MKMGEIKKIAAEMGCHPTTLFRKLKGVRGISKDDAVNLEHITGIDRRAWLWPDQYPNPMISGQEDESPSDLAASK